MVCICFLGESCTEKPLNTLWKNYTSSSKPDVQMKLIVTQSGLKAITKEHGLTEYWSHRITYCCAPTDLPKIFCWVYRHEGRKLKQELRCHAVLCAKESVARQIANQLQARLTQALIEFKRDKISRQNARLSLANSVYDNPSLPRRKILLSTGSHNYRPPLERSKSAPKLMAIEESLEEEDENADCRKMSKRIDIKNKFATCRNLSYSNRGSRMGGLHGVKCKTSVSFHSLPPFETENSSQYKECTATDVVEENPFGCRKNCDLLDVFEKELTLDEVEEATAPTSVADQTSKPITDINENICESPRAKFFHRKSWSTNDDEDDDDYSSCPTYSDSVSVDDLGHLPKYEDLICVDEDRKCDSLVRSRKRLFECGEKVVNRKCVPDESPRRNLVKNRKRIFECADRTEIGSGGDTDSALQFDLSEESRDSLECVGSVDDESTPSLQSISSGSDTSPPRDIKLEYTKNYDMDSLWEEDSDESGFVEAIGQDANDDKVRDLPHHHLMKSCILSSKSRCVEV